jgi:Uma2 family endonuclease
MSVASSRPYVPLEEFLLMEPEAGMFLEWSAGLVHAMSGGSPEHARLSARVIAVLAPLLEADCTVFDGKADIWVEAAQFYGQADASIACGALHTHVVKRAGKVLGEAITNPVVVVEVLSPSTQTRDRGEKFEAYKLISSLKEYVLVPLDKRRIEVRRRVEHGFRSDVAGADDAVVIHGHELPVRAFYD